MMQYSIARLSHGGELPSNHYAGILWIGRCNAPGKCKYLTSLWLEKLNMIFTILEFNNIFYYFFSKQEMFSW